MWAGGRCCRPVIVAGVEFCVLEFDEHVHGVANHCQASKCQHRIYEPQEQPAAHSFAYDGSNTRYELFIAKAVRKFAADCSMQVLVIKGVVNLWHKTAISSTSSFLKRRSIPEKPDPVAWAPSL